VEKPQYPIKVLLKDLWHFIKPYKKRYIFFVITGQLAVIISLIGPIVFAQIIDFLTEFQVGGDLTYFYQLMGVFLLIGITATILRLRSKYNINILSTSMRKDARIQGLRKLLELDMAWHESTSSGARMQKMSSGAKSIRKYISFMSFNGLRLPIEMCVALAIFTYLDIKYTIFMVAYIGLYTFFEIRFNRKISAQENKVNRLLETVSGKIYEYSSNIQTVKSLNLAKKLENKANRAEQKTLEARNEQNNTQNLKWISIQLTSTIAKTIFIFLVGWDILQGSISIGFLIMYTSYFRNVHRALNDLSSKVDDVIEWKSGIYRYMTIFKAASKIEEDTATKRLPDWKSINFEDVTFSYKHNPILKNVNLKIKRGERIGIVGESGVGKSTFFKLFLKLYVPQEGRISFNKVPLQEINRKSLLNSIAIVPQETELFNTSFKDNIVISKTKNSPKTISQALKIANCDTILPKLNNGVYSIIGEKGIKLSGGERQRLGIARAIYRNSDIYLFDEATSHLDSKSERKIMTKLIPWMKGKTILMIAHRLSTLRDMDRIIVFKKGKIAEQGTFSALLKKKGAFYKLYKQQQMKK